MNTPISNATATSPEAESLHPYYEETTAPLPAATSPAPPSLFRIKNKLILEPGGEIASHLCLKTGKPTRHQVTLSLRNPWNPGSWFVDLGKIQVGLSPQSLENFRVTRAFAWSLIGLGIIMAAASYYYDISVLVAGLFLVLAGFIIRAAFPVWCSSKNEHALVIQGCREEFLRHYPAKM